MISATAMEASTKYGPRSRKVMLPMISATTTEIATASQTPYQGGMCRSWRRMKAPYAPRP